MVPITLLKLVENNSFLSVLSSLYHSNGFELYLVGGAVRDGILDIPTEDFDFTTNATPEESIKLLKTNNYKTTEVGRNFGTIELYDQKNVVHITTFRKDTYETDSRNPEIENATDLITDLSRRDFSINSIAYSMETNELIDPFSGLKDLASGTISTITNTGTLTLPTSTDTLVGRATTDTLTNKTLTSPTINTPKIGTSINDTTGNEVIKITATGSAVNELTIANGASTTGPTLSATGGGANLNIIMTPKGTGSVELNKAAFSSSTLTANGAASTSATLIIGNKGSQLDVSLADGTTVGEYKIFTNKGAGAMHITPTNFSAGTKFVLTQNQGASCIWDGSNWFLVGNQSTSAVS